MNFGRMTTLTMIDVDWEAAAMNFVVLRTTVIFYLMFGEITFKDLSAGNRFVNSRVPIILMRSVR